MLHGSDLGGTGAVVEMARLDDGKPAAPSAASNVKEWTRAPVLQGDDQTLKFVVPASWRMGVFVCRVTAGGAASEPVLLNAPDPWWVQGDEGEAASPGGWLRVLGKCLNVGGHACVRLDSGQGMPTLLQPKSADDFSLRFDLPDDLKPDSYTVWLHNGNGGDAAWRSAGTVQIQAAPAAPTTIYSVLDSYGPEAVRQMRDSLVKYNQPIDRTDVVRRCPQEGQGDNGGRESRLLPRRPLRRPRAAVRSGTHDPPRGGRGAGDAVVGDRPFQPRRRRTSGARQGR